jgi:hypothetical protein
VKALGYYVLYFFPAFWLILIILGVGIWLYSLFKNRGRKRKTLKDENKVIYL